MIGSRMFPPAKYFNRRLGLSCLLVALSSFNYGFDNQGYATSQAMDQFDKQFGSWNPKTHEYYLPTSWLSLFNSLQYIGFAAGVIVGTLISSKFGRRWCIFAMSCFALCTATIAVTSHVKEQIMAARILNYLYVGMELSVVPVYQSEVVPGPVRSFAVSTYQLMLLGGGIVINLVCYRTEQLDGEAAFRIPFGLFYIVPTIVLSGVWFVPESPVWLMRNGRREAARENLRKLRSGCFTDEEIDEESRQLEAAVELAEEHRRFTDIFKGKNLKRTMIVVFANFFQQATGQVFASQYGAVWIKSLHTISAFKMSVTLSAIDIAATLVAIMISDKVGRKPLLYAGAIAQSTTLITMGILGCVEPQTTKIRLAIVAMLALTTFFFALGLATLIYVISTEIPSQTLRDHTVRVGFLTKVIVNFVVAFSIPYIINPGYGNLNAKIGFIFGAVCILSLAFIYFCVPECKGRSLDEIELMFQAGVPIRKFKSYDTSELMAAAALSRDDIKRTDSVAHVEES